MLNKIILMVFFVVSSASHANKSEYEAERYNLDEIVVGVERFKGDLGYYPNSGALNDLKENSSRSINWKGPYVSADETFKDLNGDDLIYKNYGGAYYLYSIGADKVDDGGMGDDIRPHPPGDEWDFSILTAVLFFMLMLVLIFLYTINKKKL